MRPACALAFLALAACEAPRDADFVPSEAARTAPPPLLAETAQFDAALAGAGPEPERLEADAATLSARAEALRARAEALAAPVIDPAMRPQLEAPTRP